MRRVRLIAGLLAAVFVHTATAHLEAGPPPAPAPSNYIVYVGTYTGKGSDGIYAWRFDAATGQLTQIGLVGATANPSFLAMHPSGKFLYAVNETSKGTVTSFRVDAASAKLTRLNQAPSGGADPCHLVVDPSGHLLIVANYSSGSVASFVLNADGSLGRTVSFLMHNGSSVNRARQERAHAHDVVLSHDNRLAIVCDLGMDKLMIYGLDAKTGALSAHDPPYAMLEPGSGPRHFAFDPAGKHGYGINELASTITVFDWDAARGALEEAQTVSTLPADFHGQNTAAEIAIHPSGWFLYGSNRGDNSLAEFVIDRVSGRLTAGGRFSSEGRTPRHFAIDPTGQWLLAANQDSNEIVEFRIDQRTGALTPGGQRVSVSQPVCVLFQ